MKISELIKTLKEIQKDLGDLECGVLDPDQLAEGVYADAAACIAVNMNDDGTADSLTFVDAETAEAFYEG